MDPLDRELAEAINVNPSPEFTARVRMRVAAERTPRSRVSMLFLASASLTIAMLMAAWLLREGRTNRQTGHVQVATAVSAQAVQRPTDRFPVTTKPVSSAKSVTVRPRQPSQQVIVAAEEIEGLRGLSALVRERVVLTFSSDAQCDDSTLSPPLRDINVAPIEIAPLTLASITEEGDAQ